MVLKIRGEVADVHAIEARAKERGLPEARELYKKRMPNVYQLIAIELETRGGTDRRVIKDAEGAIKAQERMVGLYASVEQAEYAILAYIDHVLEWTAFLGFFIKELPLGEAYDGSKGICEYKSIRSYDAEGKFLCFSDLDSDCEKEFFGRDPKTLFYKPGSFAYCFSRGTAMPILVGSIPFTEKGWRLRFSDKKTGIVRGGDWSDDSCWALCVDGHCHPNVAEVFPLCAPITKKIKAKLRYAKKVETVPGEYEKWCKRLERKEQAERNKIKESKK